MSPFFGINLRVAVRKLGNSTPVSKQCNEYCSSGTRRYPQNFLIKALFIPSGLAAVLVFVADYAASSSANVSGVSSLARSHTVSLELFTIG